MFTDQQNAIEADMAPFGFIDNGLDDPEAISRVARNGIGIMNGYANVLGEGDDQLVANWIWNQAQKAWIQG